MKRHQTIVGPSLSSRALVPAAARATLPTVAALAAMLSFAPSAHAIYSTKDTGVEATEGDAATDAESDAEGDAPDAAYCPPDPDYPALGGVPVSTSYRVHGAGCGCGGHSSDDDTTTALFAAAAVVALVRQIRRRG
ncbi:MAG: hypothetical protein ACXVEE_29035 [Polyangiales bacterium]